MQSPSGRKGRSSSRQCSLLRPLSRREAELQPYLAACNLLRRSEAAQFAAAAKIHALDYSRTQAIYCQLPADVPQRVGSVWLNLDELVDTCFAEDVPLPPYVWATKPRPLKLDAAEILETADEDVGAAALQELQALLDAWGRKHADIEVDTSVAILLAESADPAQPPRCAS